MRFIFATTAMLCMTVASAAHADRWAGTDPVTDGTLAHVTGKASPSTRLSVLVSELNAANGQWVGENMRVALENWFADGTVQEITNTAKFQQ